METLGNNGNQLAELMHFDGLLKDGLTLDKCAEIAKGVFATQPHQQKWLLNDDFWEDFSYRAGELGYNLKY